MYDMCHQRPWKAWLLLSCACAVLAMSTAAASPAHRHSELIGNDCDLCCIGHLPALQSPLLFDIRPPVVLKWQVPAEEFLFSPDPGFSARFGRAPPFQLTLEA